jgi:Transposase DDE domain
LEAEAKAAAAAKAKAQEKAEEQRRAEGRKKPGNPAAPPSEEPDPKAQKNFTDPESRILKTKDGFIQGYNAQAAVDATAQVKAPGRAKHAGDGEGGGARVAAMREKIKAGGHASPYRLRKQLPEPVFGQIKHARGFRQFLLRSVEQVAAEWGSSASSTTS